MTDLEIELMFFINKNIKPNFSSLARHYKKDRHTIRKMYDDIIADQKEKQD